MKKQKICIIGGGLTGLITALVLSKLNLDVDLVTGSNEGIIKSNRTTAISQDNYNFLKKLKIIDPSKIDIWPCSKMQLYSKNKSEKFEETNKMFEKPNSPDIHITSFLTDEEIKKLAEKIIDV